MALARRGRRRGGVRLDGRVEHAVDPVAARHGHGGSGRCDRDIAFTEPADDQSERDSASGARDLGAPGTAADVPPGSRGARSRRRHEDANHSRSLDPRARIDSTSVARQQRLADARSRLRVRPIDRPAPGFSAAVAAGNRNQEDHHFRADLRFRTTGLGKLALAPGARLEVPGRRVSIRQWVTSGAKEITINSIELPQFADVSRQVESGSRVVTYALVNDARHEAIPLTVRGTSGGSSWLVLPGDEVLTRELTLDTREAFAGRSAGVDGAGTRRAPVARRLGAGRAAIR